MFDIVLWAPNTISRVCHWVKTISNIISASFAAEGLLQYALFTISNIVLGWHNIKCQPTQCQTVFVQSPKTMFDIVAGQCVTVWQGNIWYWRMITQKDYTDGKAGIRVILFTITKQKNTRLFRPILTRDGTGTDRNVECMHSIHIGFRSASWKWQSEEYPLPSDSWSGTWHWLAGRLRIWEEIFLCVY